MGRGLRSSPTHENLPPAADTEKRLQESVST